MNKKNIILCGILIVCGVVLFGVIKGPSTVTTKVVLTGSDGLQINGKYIADGIEHSVNEVLPAEITIAAKRMSLLVESSDESGSFFAKVFVNDEHRVSGGHLHIQIDVSGNTMFSSSKAHLKAF